MTKPFSCVLASALSGVLLMSGCTRVESLGRPPAKGPLTVNVTCDQDVSIGLVDAAGNQAWAFEAKAKDPVEWQVGANVTTIDIQAKDAANPLPLDSTPHGNGSGKPAKSTIKDGAAKGTYAYRIVVTCQPSASGSAPIKITIDPDMIII